MEEIKIDRLPARYSPVVVIPEHFDELQLPIAGGWGYEKEDAVVIFKRDPAHTSVAPYKAIDIEMQFVKCRLIFELIWTREHDEKYEDVRWDIAQQKVRRIEGRTYDVLDLKVSATPRNEWLISKSEWESKDWQSEEEEDLFRINYESKMHVTNSQFWFDISDFFN